jgi:hypothetical protein
VEREGSEPMVPVLEVASLGGVVPEERRGGHPAEDTWRSAQALQGSGSGSGEHARSRACGRGGTGNTLPAFRAQGRELSIELYLYKRWELGIGSGRIVAPLGSVLNGMRVAGR